MVSSPSSWSLPDVVKVGGEWGRGGKNTPHPAHTHTYTHFSLNTLLLLSFLYLLWFGIPPAIYFSINFSGQLFSHTLMLTQPHVRPQINSIYISYVFRWHFMSIFLFSITENIKQFFKWREKIKAAIVDDLCPLVDYIKRRHDMSGSITGYPLSIYWRIRNHFF